MCFVIGAGVIIGICYVIYLLLFSEWPQVTEQDLQKLIEEDRKGKLVKHD